MTRPDPLNPQDNPVVPPTNGAEGAGPVDADAGTSGGAELASARKEAAEARDRYLRAVADLENFRRRSVREKEDLRQFATASLMESLLPVMDNLTLGLAACRQGSPDLKNVTGGIEMVFAQLKSVLQAQGLTEISPVGKAFDPQWHEAISHQSHPTIPAEHVASVVRPGYSLNGRLLRPASVIVSSGLAPEGSSRA